MEAPIIEATDVTKNFKLGSSTIQVLRGPNLTVKKGEFVAIVDILTTVQGAVSTPFGVPALSVDPIFPADLVYGGFPLNSHQPPSRAISYVESLATPPRNSHKVRVKAPGETVLSKKEKGNTLEE